MPERKRPTVEIEPWFDKLLQRYEQWAGELGVKLRDLHIVDSAGQKKRFPNLDNRSTRMRIREGRAFEIRQDLYAALSKLESAMSKPTATGRTMHDVEEWARIGRAMAHLNAEQFERTLVIAQAHLESMEAINRKDVNFQPPAPSKAQPPHVAKKPARSIAKPRLSSPVGGDDRTGDELPWERGKKKPA